MPTYVYRCPKCGTEYEKFQKMSDHSGAACPACGTRGDRQISGGAGLVFKGSGFYITDYKRASEKKPSGEPSPKDDSKKKKEASDKKPKPSKGAES